MGYFLGVFPGEVGDVNMEPGASISAWLHECKHFCDDKEDGFLGLRVLADSDKCAKRERDAYQVEIDFAYKMGYNNNVENWLS